MKTKGTFIKLNRLLLYLAWVMLAIGVLVCIYFIISTKIDGFKFWGETKIDFPTTGQFGDFFGGVVGTLFALSGTILIILTFRIQSKQYEREVFEAKFYEMLKLHRENVKELQVSDNHGRKAFEFLIGQLRLYYNDVKEAFDKLKRTEDPRKIDSDLDNLSKIKEYLNSIENHEKFLLIHKLSYGYFFYGIDEYHLTKDKTDIIYEINLAITIIIKTNLLSLPEDRRYERNGHFNSHLGHYYRHLFHLISLIANEDILSEKEKYGFSKIIRAQLSDYEQILLYYNSLSVMGEQWISPLGKHEVKKMCFIARFRLIKNAPYYFRYFGINPASLFKTEIDALDEIGQAFFEIKL